MEQSGIQARARHQEDGSGVVRPGHHIKKPTAMKKTLAFLVSSLAALGLATGQASAWFRDCHSCSSKCCTTICLRQYNAFTPICYGSINCDGCCPMGFGGFCGMPMSPHGYDMWGGNGFAGHVAHAGYGQAPGYGPATYAPRAPWMVPMMPTPSPAVPAPAKESLAPDGKSHPAFRSPLPTPMDPKNPVGIGGGPTAYAPQAVPYVVPVVFMPSYQPVVPPTYPGYSMKPYYWHGAPAR
jgi:hypothetical protein